MYLTNIWEPVVTGVVPDDAHMDMMVLLMASGITVLPCMMNRADLKICFLSS